jgi:hypothetical protein
MAGKPSVFASRQLFCVLESLTKNQLIDLLVDIARRELDRRNGKPTDREIVHWIQPHIDRVWKARGDSRVDLQNRLREISVSGQRSHLTRKGELKC